MKESSHLYLVISIEFTFIDPAEIIKYLLFNFAAIFLSGLWLSGQVEIMILFFPMKNKFND